MKKIVFVLEQLYGGGAERVTNALANEICKLSGYESHIVTYRSDVRVEYERDSRVIRHNMGQTDGDPNGLRGIVRRINYLRQTICDIGPWCVVSLATPRTTCLLSAAMIGLRIPLILSERNDPAHFPQERLVRFLRTVCYFFADGLVFQTKDAQGYFSRTIQSKSTVIVNPLTADIPERFEGSRQKTIVNFCRFTVQKNLDLLIDAFARICVEFPDYTLCLYGEGPLKDHLTEKINNLGLSNRVALPGYSNEIFEDIRDAALFVSSSDYEGISNSMLEAIAIGVPVVCTDCPAGGARETIRNGINGILVPVGDANAMADAMRKVLSDPDLSDVLSREGSQLRFDLSSENIAAKWINFMKKVVE